MKDNYIFIDNKEIAEIKIKYLYIQSVVDAGILFESAYKGWQPSDFLKNIEGLANKISKIIEGETGVLYTQRNGKNLYHLINNNKIIVIRAGGAENIPKARGLMMMSSIMNTIMERSKYPKAEFPPTALVIDEFHFYSTLAFITFLTTCRSTNTGVLVAYQGVEQLEEEISKALNGNCSITIALGGGEFDTCETFAKQFGYEYYVLSSYTQQKGTITSQGNISQAKELVFRIHPTKLRELPKNYAVFQIKYDRQTYPPIYIKLLNPVEKTDEELPIYRTPINYEENIFVKYANIEMDSKLKIDKHKQSLDEAKQTAKEAQTKPTPANLSALKLTQKGSIMIYQEGDYQYLVLNNLPKSLSPEERTLNTTYTYKGLFTNNAEIKIVEIISKNNNGEPLPEKEPSISPTHIPNIPDEIITDKTMPSFSSAAPKPKIDNVSISPIKTPVGETRAIPAFLKSSTNVNSQKSPEASKSNEKEAPAFRSPSMNGTARVLLQKPEEK